MAGRSRSNNQSQFCIEAIADELGNRTSAFEENQTTLIRGGLAMFSLSSIHVVFGLVVFMYAKYHWKDQYSRLAPRAVVPVVAGAIGVLCHGVIDVLRDAIGVDKFLCSVSTVLAFMAICFILSPIIVRLVEFANHIYYLKAVRRYARELDADDTFQQQRAETNSVGGETQLTQDSGATSRDEYDHHNYGQSVCFRFFITFKYLLGFSPKTSPEQPYAAPNVAPTHSSKKEKLRGFEEELLAKRFLVSEYWIALMTVHYSLYFVVIVGILLAEKPYLRSGCVGCFFDRDLGIPLYLFAVLISLLFAAYLVYRLRRCKDSFGMLAELRLAVLLGAPLAILGSSMSAFAPEITAGGHLRFSWITSIGFNLMFFVQTTYQVIQAYKDRSREANVLERNREASSSEAEASLSHRRSGGKNKVKQLKDQLLESEEFRERFMQWLQREWCPELLRFFEVAAKWKDFYHERVESTRRAHANKIASIYIDDSAAMQVNIGDKTRKHIVEILQNKSSKIELSLFDRAIDEVLRLMAEGPYARYLLAGETGQQRRADTSSRVVTPNTV